MPSHGRRLPPVTTITLLALAGLYACLLAACGGSSPANGSGSSEARAETKLADLARCMREHGFKAEVATLPTGGRGLKISPGTARGPGASQAAQKACARYHPAPQNVNLTPQQKVEQQEDVRRFGKCMREHGIAVSASANGGAIRITLRGRPGEGGPNPASPAFRQAQATCQKLLPHGKP